MPVPGTQAPSLYTPPESVNSPPSTPPPTDAKPSRRAVRIYNALRSRQLNQVIESNPWRVFQLDSEEYDAILRLLQADDALRAYVEDKIRCVWLDSSRCSYAKPDNRRYDYIPSARRFVLRMPSKVHEAFNARVVQEIQSQLSTIARGTGPAADFARQIDHDGSERLTFSVPKIGEEGFETTQHEPDAVFEHIDAQFPGVIIEVSFTQKRKDLNRLADSYILGSEGNIRVVVGLDIEYGTSKRSLSKRATISLWRPKYKMGEKGEMDFMAEQTVTDLVSAFIQNRPCLNLQ